MKHLRILSVFALALAFSASAFAETQTVKVSGSVDAKWIYRENLDLREGNGAAVIPVGGTMTGNPDPTSSLFNSDDATDWFMSTAQVEIAARHGQRAAEWRDLPHDDVTGLGRGGCSAEARSHGSREKNTSRKAHGDLRS